MHAADRSKSAPVLFLIDTLVVGGSEKKTVAVSVSGKRDEWLRRWRLDPSAFIVGSIARLRKEKNHQDLIRALERLVAQGVHAQCLIAGDGPERNALRGMAADLGVEKRVVFAGDLTDVRPALLAMDVFVLTSKAVETFSNAALEAMAMARPERVTRWAGTSVPSRPVAVGNAG